jgi:hypothetical protein
MTIIQLLITVIAVVGVVVIVMLAIIPSPARLSPWPRQGRIRYAGTDPAQAR